MAYLKRLMKELDAIKDSKPNGVTIDFDRIGGNLLEWYVGLEGADHTLFEGETFQLQFKFSTRYPFESPQVKFIGSSIPCHPHVYSNGHICLSILTDDWSPALTVETVCLSVISMLSSCKEKKRPPDDSVYSMIAAENPKKTHWLFHDDDV